MPVRPGDNDLTHQHEGRPVGQTITLTGRVLDSDGRGVPNTLIEIWQTNASGAYLDPADPQFMSLDPNFTGAGRTITDSEGRYQFRTIKPAAYPGELGGLFRPAHIHTSLFGSLLGSRLITQCYFDGDPLLNRDPILNSIPDRRGIDRLIARFNDAETEVGGVDSALAYDWDIVLRGPAVTPFETLMAEIIQSPSQTIGPLYGFALMFEGSHEAVPPDSPGAVRIEGLILDGDGVPVNWPEGFIEIWEGDQWARARTDDDGVYRVVRAQARAPGDPGRDRARPIPQRRGVRARPAQAGPDPRSTSPTRRPRTPPTRSSSSCPRRTATCWSLARMGTCCASTSVSRARTRLRSSPSDRLLDRRFSRWLLTRACRCSPWATCSPTSPTGARPSRR